jgi:hypothetical protein
LRLWRLEPGQSRFFLSTASISPIKGSQCLLDSSSAIRLLTQYIAPRGGQRSALDYTFYQRYRLTEACF